MDGREWVPGKADVQKQEKWIAQYHELRQNAGSNEFFYFDDGCHPRLSAGKQVHNSVPAYGWIRRGAKRFLKSNVHANT
ncbi:MAG: hypothetical protein Q4D62_16185 [Planctomycetia bacterium]|nr:hypothetical protein [Planctomycetia bacterium]